MADRVILWTYYEGFYPLKVCVWTDDRRGIWADAVRGDGGYVQMEIQGLKPYTRYRYAFSEIGLDGQLVAQSQVGRFKTALAEDALQSIKLGAVSCVKHWFEPRVLEQAAKEDLDFFIFNGDNSYNDGMKTLDEYRGRWGKTIAMKGYQDVRRSMSMVATIDDHDIEDNFDVEHISRTKLEAGLQAYFEHMPMRRDELNPDQVWRKLSWGKTLDIFVLDCRTERRPSRNQYISHAQMKWLKQGLVQSKAMFKIIMNSVPITEYPVWFPMSHDRWQGYPEQRQEILSFIDEQQIQNLLWLSGDFHFTSLGRVSSSGIGSTQTEALAGPGAQISNPVGLGLKAYSQFDWVYVQNSYLTINCDVEQQKMEVVPRFLD
jgi:alkaline phosphatase D